MSDEELNDLETEPEGFDDESLDQYVEKETPCRDFMAEQLRRAPWWIISFLVHVLALLIMWKWPYRATASFEVYNPIEVELVAEQEETEFEQEEIEEPPQDEDIEVPIEDIPIQPDTPSPEDPGPDLDLPPED